MATRPALSAGRMRPRMYARVCRLQASGRPRTQTPLRLRRPPLWEPLLGDLQHGGGGALQAEISFNFAADEADGQPLPPGKQEEFRADVRRDLARLESWAVGHRWLPFQLPPLQIVVSRQVPDFALAGAGMGRPRRIDGVSGLARRSPPLRHRARTRACRIPERQPSAGGRPGDLSAGRDRRQSGISQFRPCAARRGDRVHAGDEADAGRRKRGDGFRLDRSSPISTRSQHPIRLR